VKYSVKRSLLPRHPSSVEAARGQQRPLHVYPAVLAKVADHRPETSSLRHRHVVKIEGASSGHPVLGHEDDLGREAADRARGGNDDDLTERIDRSRACKNEDWSTFVRRPERVPADFPAVHAMSSQPSASQASGSLESLNSPSRTGVAL